MTYPPSPWTEELVSKLKELWADNPGGAVADFLNREYGLSLTRNAVIGKATRLRLPLKTKPEVAPKPKAPRVRKPSVPRRRYPGEIAAPPVPFVLRLVDLVPLHITLNELTDDNCKYECSGADHPSEFTFCGHDVKAGKSWCPTHCRLVFVPPRPEQRPYVPSRFKAA